MKQNTNQFEIISLLLTFIIISGLLLFFNLTFNPDKPFIVDSGDVLWIDYLIKFYVVFSVIGLTINLILMHIIFSRMKGFHEG
jgi:hypothetical protein